MIKAMPTLQGHSLLNEAHWATAPGGKYIMKDRRAGV